MLSSVLFVKRAFKVKLLLPATTAFQTRQEWSTIFETVIMSLSSLPQESNRTQGYFAGGGFNLPENALKLSLNSLCGSDEGMEPVN